MHLRMYHSWKNWEHNHSNVCSLTQVWYPNWERLGSVTESLYYKVTALQIYFVGRGTLSYINIFILKNFHLFMCLFTRVRTPDFRFYSMSYTLLSFILMLTFFLIWPVGAHGCWLRFLLDMTLSFFPGEGKASHSSIIAWRIPMDREPGGLQSMGSQRVGHGWVTKHYHSLSISFLETRSLGSSYFGLLLQPWN